MAAARPLRRTQHRIAGGRSVDQRRRRGRAARKIGPGLAARTRRGARADRGRAADSEARIFSTKRACPNCGNGFPELDPRLFSFNSKHGWCEMLLRHRLAIAAVRCRTKRRGSGVAGRHGCAARGVFAMRRATPESPRVARAVSRAVDRGVHGPAGAGVRGTARQIEIGRPRKRYCARFVGGTCRAHRVSLRRRPGISAIESRRAHACPAARRSAFVWRRNWDRTCRAFATFWTNRPSACTRATMSRCSIPWSGCAPRETHWSSSSMTRTRSAAPITSSIWAPARDPAAGAWWRKAPQPNWRDSMTRRPAGVWRRRCCIPDRGGGQSSATLR